MDLEEALFGLGVVQQHGGDEGLVVAVADELIVRYVGGEGGGGQEIGGSEVIALRDVHT